MSETPVNRNLSPNVEIATPTQALSSVREILRRGVTSDGQPNSPETRIRYSGQGLTPQERKEAFNKDVPQLQQSVTEVLRNGRANMSPGFLLARTVAAYDVAGSALTEEIFDPHAGTPKEAAEGQRDMEELFEYFEVLRRALEPDDHGRITAAFMKGNKFSLESTSQQRLNIANQTLEGITGKTLNEEGPNGPEIDWIGKRIEVYQEIIKKEAIGTPMTPGDDLASGMERPQPLVQEVPRLSLGERIQNEFGVPIESLTAKQRKVAEQLLELGEEPEIRITPEFVKQIQTEIVGGYKEIRRNLAIDRIIKEVEAMTDLSVNQKMQLVQEREAQLTDLSLSTQEFQFFITQPVNQKGELVEGMSKTVDIAEELKRGDLSGISRFFDSNVNATAITPEGAQELDDRVKARGHIVTGIAHIHPDGFIAQGNLGEGGPNSVLSGGGGDLASLSRDRVDLTKSPTKEDFVTNLDYLTKAVLVFNPMPVNGRSYFLVGHHTLQGYLLRRFSIPSTGEPTFREEPALHSDVVRLEQQVRPPLKPKALFGIFNNLEAAA